MTSTWDFSQVAGAEWYLDDTEKFYSLEAESKTIVLSLDDNPPFVDAATYMTDPQENSSCSDIPIPTEIEQPLVPKQEHEHTESRQPFNINDFLVSDEEYERLMKKPTLIEIVCSFYSSSIQCEHLNSYESIVPLIKKKYLEYYPDSPLTDIEYFKEIKQKRSYTNNKHLSDFILSIALIFRNLDPTYRAERAKLLQQKRDHELSIAETTAIHPLHIPCHPSEETLPIRSQYCNGSGQSDDHYTIKGKEFKRQNVSGSGMNCFFNALGLDRKQQVTLLSQFRGNAVVRHMIANDIISAAYDPAQLSRNVKRAINYKEYEEKQRKLDELSEKRNDFLLKHGGNTELLPAEYQDLEQQYTRIRQELYQRSVTDLAYDAFIKNHISGRDMMVMIPDLCENGNGNFSSIDAIAYVNTIGIKIYRKYSQGLRLTHCYIPENAKEVAYIYHEGVHFQALLPVDNQEMPEQTVLPTSAMSIDEPVAPAHQPIIAPQSTETEPSEMNYFMDTCGGDDYPDLPSVNTRGKKTHRSKSLEQTAPRPKRKKIRETLNPGQEHSLRSEPSSSLSQPEVNTDSFEIAAILSQGPRQD